VTLRGFCVCPVASSAAQEGTLDKSEPKGITVDEVIKRFAPRRRSFRRRGSYTYRQDVKVQTIEGDTPDAASTARSST